VTGVQTCALPISPPLRVIRTEQSATGIALGGDEIFGTGFAENTLSVYNRLASGAALPLREISAKTTGLIDTAAMVVDPQNDEVILVARCGAVWCISSYQGAASGDTRPLRSITVDSAQTIQPVGIALNQARDELALLMGTSYPSLEPASALIYDRRASGSTPPLRTLTLTSPGIDSADPAAPRVFTAIAADPLLQEIIIAAYQERVVGTSRTVQSSLLVFSAEAAGNAAPLRVITGTMTGMAEPVAVQVDTVNGEIVVASRADGGSVTAYPRMAAGDVAPVRRITWTVTGTSAPLSLAVDTVNDEFLVSSRDAITAYPRLGSGAVVPLRVYTGYHEPPRAIGLGRLLPRSPG